MRTEKLPTVAGLSPAASGTVLGVLAVVFYGRLALTRPPSPGAGGGSGFVVGFLLGGAALALVGGAVFAALYHDAVGRYGLPESLDDVALQRDEAAAVAVVTALVSLYVVFEFV